MFELISLIFEEIFNHKSAKFGLFFCKNKARICHFWQNCTSLISHLCTERYRNLTVSHRNEKYTIFSTKFRKVSSLWLKIRKHNRLKLCDTYHLKFLHFFPWLILVYWNSRLTLMCRFFLLTPIPGKWKSLLLSF